MLLGVVWKIRRDSWRFFPALMESRFRSAGRGGGRRCRRRSKVCPRSGTAPGSLRGADADEQGLTGYTGVGLAKHCPGFGKAQDAALSPDIGTGDDGPAFHHQPHPLGGFTLRQNYRPLAVASLHCARQDSRAERSAWEMPGKQGSLGQIHRCLDSAAGAACFFPV